MVAITKLVLGAATLITTGNALFTGIFKNNCGEPVDVEMNAHGRTAGRQTVWPGQSITHPFEPPMCGSGQNCGGVTFLMYKQGATGTSLAAEYGNGYAQDGVLEMWYNWSNDKGNPFLDRARIMTPGAGCPAKNCAAGSESCDWKANGGANIGHCRPNPFWIELRLCG